MKRGVTTGDSFEKRIVSQNLLCWWLPSSYNMLKATELTLKDYLSQ
jgi:hypothetical protein